jgi:hypothetical protein
MAVDMLLTAKPIDIKGFQLKFMVLKFQVNPVEK